MKPNNYLVTSFSRSTIALGQATKHNFLYLCGKKSAHSCKIISCDQSSLDFAIYDRNSAPPKLYSNIRACKKANDLPDYKCQLND